jgi:nicotinate-nucleotide adenylyltransferase
LLTQNKPPIYTIQTLRKLYPNFDTIKEKIPILIGADAFATLPTWKEAQKLAEHLLFIVSKRENIPISRNMVIDGKNIPISVKTFEIPVIGLSSTLIRERVRKGLSLEGLVPQAIKDFIQRKGLYREPDPVKFSGALLLHQVA